MLRMFSKSMEWAPIGTAREITITNFWRSRKTEGNRGSMIEESCPASNRGGDALHTHKPTAGMKTILANVIISGDNKCLLGQMQGKTWVIRICPIEITTRLVLIKRNIEEFIFYIDHFYFANHREPFETTRICKRPMLEGDH